MCVGDYASIDRALGHLPVRPRNIRAYENDGFLPLQSPNFGTPLPERCSDKHLMSCPRGSGRFDAEIHLTSS